jgi:hypothetical protein
MWTGQKWFARRERSRARTIDARSAHQCWRCR